MAVRLNCTKFNYFLKSFMVSELKINEHSRQETQVATLKFSYLNTCIE